MLLPPSLDESNVNSRVTLPSFFAAVNVFSAVTCLPSIRTGLPVSLSIMTPLTVYSLPAMRFE